MSNEIQDNKKIPSRRNLLLISLLVFVASATFYSYLTTSEPVTIVTIETIETTTIVKEPDTITKVVTVLEEVNKEQSESGLAREPDTEMTEKKLETITSTWSENDMRRMELNRNKPAGYEQMVIQEFESGKLSHVNGCSQLNGYYLLYYGQVYGNQWDYSKNKLVTDYLKERMWAIDCDFKEQAELKEKIDAEKQRVDEAVEKVMQELEEVNKEN